MSVYLQKRPKLSWAIRWPVSRLEISSEALIAAVSLYFVVACNSVFWHSLSRNGASPGLMASFFVAVFSLHALLLALLSPGRLLKPLLGTLLVVTGFATFYMTRYAVLFDVEMINNVLQTDAAESRELLSIGMLLHVAVFGVAPAAALFWVRVKPRTFKSGFASRAIFVATMGVLAGLAIAISSQGIFAMMRSDKALRYQITPGNYIVSFVRAVTASPDLPPSARLPVAADARIAAQSADRKPRVLVMVVGETVRAENWGLNGYSRQTTPKLAEREVINFSQVQSCGTSTEVSLPCMFSVFGRDNYDKQKIRNHESLLDVVARAGVKVQWRDNQSGCKGVCDGVGIERMSDSIAPELCTAGRCLDDILLTDLQSRIDSSTGDVLVVLHQLGNHGPNYFERYPAEYEVFKPTCRTPELSQCTSEQIVNAYDNAIVYTDAFLSRTLDVLKAQTTHDAAMLYVSDHGESLGEYGLYLHGAPYAIAPQQQLHVPMALWMSSELASDSGIDLHCMRERSNEPRSHDNLFHSVLGLFEIQTQAYQRNRDVFAECRSGSIASR